MKLYDEGKMEIKKKRKEMEIRKKSFTTRGLWREEESVYSEIGK